MNHTNLEIYSDEAKERWGGTEAWKEYEKKSSSRSPEDQKAVFNGLMKIFEKLGKMKDLPPSDPAVQAEISGLQEYITAHFYKCTDEIFSGLGKMYAADPRFKETIDRAGGPGTADFASKAIDYFCKSK